MKPVYSTYYTAPKTYTYAAPVYGPKTYTSSYYVPNYRPSTVVTYYIPDPATAGGNSMGGLIGGIIGGVVFLSIVIGVTVCCLKKNKPHLFN